ncbi:transcriptional repressor LexA [Maioricimonas sp. JC845]|uniref:transcriptional repressor LexA n=1 Tax=Maioricimonas sp. JC845 TaxID=3232138 RepID=UPI00345ADD65
MATKQPKRGRGRPPVEEITPKQRETLRAVRGFLAQRGHPPTIGELAELLEVTRPTAHASVKQLVRKGYLKREPNKRRGISIAREPVGEMTEQVEIPVLGHVSAGRLSFAEENIVGQVGVDAYLVRSGQYFGLQVVGDSMIGAGIRDGDTVVVRHQPLAENGDIVVACVGDEATVKRLLYSPDRIELQAENPTYPPIEIGAEQMDEFRIVGRVVAHVRRRTRSSSQGSTRPGTV